MYSFTMKIRSSFRQKLGLLLIVFGFLSCQTLVAQNCQSTSDGLVESLIGSDFNRKDSSVVNQNFATESILTTTLSGVRILPDGGPLPPSAQGYLNSLTYDETLSANNTYLITDSVFSRWGANEYAVLPTGTSDGNAFYVLRPNSSQRGSVMFYFPWELYRGRAGSLEFRFFIGNLGGNEIQDHGASYGLGFENGAGGDPTWVTVVKDSVVNEEGDTFCGGGFSTLVANGETFPLVSGGIARTELECENVKWNYYGWYTMTIDITAFPNYSNPNFANLFYVFSTNIYNHDDQDVIFFDYVGMKTEHICIDKGQGCPGEQITLSAHHYQEGAEIEWQVNYPKVGASDGVYNTWTPFATKVFSSNDNKVTFNYQMVNGLYPDTVQFRAIVKNNMTENVGQDISFVVEFAKRLDCVKYPDTLAGLSAQDTLLCVTKETGAAAQRRYFLTPYDETNLGNGMNGYVWAFLNEKGEDLISQIEVDTVPSVGRDSLYFYLTLPNNLDGEYLFRVIAQDPDPSKADDPKAKDTVSVKIFAYQTPDVDVLLKDEAGQLLGASDSVCISKYGKVTIAADSIGYFYSWNNAAFTENPLIELDKPACGTKRMPVSLDVNRVIRNDLTCTLHIDTLFKFKNNTANDVVCTELPSEIELQGESKDTLLYLPFPTFLSCADSAKIGLQVSKILAEGDPSLLLDRSWDNLLEKLPTDTSVRLENGNYKIRFSVEERCYTKVCDINLTVKDITMPSCGKYWNDKTLFYAFDSCKVDTSLVGFNLPAASWGELSEVEKEILKDKLGISDNSGEALTLTMNRTFGGVAEKLNAPFPIGETTLEWKVVDGSGNFCIATQVITILDSVPLVCPKITNDHFYVQPDDCSYSFAQLVELGYKDSLVADNCRGDQWVAHAMRQTVDGTTIGNEHIFNLGLDSIFYTYKIERDPSKFIAERNLACHRYVTLIDTVSPKCGNFWGKTLFYAETDCSVDTASVALNLGAVTAAGIGATDNCSLADSLTIQFARTCNGASVAWDEPYPIGETLISWTITDLSGNSCTSSQKLTVLDSVPLTCPEKTNDIFYVEPDGNSYTFGELVELGYKDSVVTDFCRQVKVAHAARVDDENVAINDAYEFGLGKDSLYYTYKIDADYGKFIASRSLSCMRYVTLLDTVVPTFDNSNVADAAIACQDEMLKEWPAISDNSGGQIVVTLDSVSTQSENTADSTYYNYTVTKTWFATDESGNIDSLTQVITVRDTESPTFNTIPKDTLLRCDGEYVHKWPMVEDNCAPIANITLTLRDSVSTQSENLDSCTHYSYTITKTWLAKDPTGNSNTVTQVITIKDTVAPSFVVTKDTVMPIYEGRCIYRVPDLSSLVMSDLDDNCADVENLIYTQTPDTTERISQTTTVYIRLADPCGNSTLDSVTIFVETSKEAIISVSMDEIAACSADSVDLTKQVSVEGTVYQTDYYFKEISSNPIYSTGAWRFAGDSILKSSLATGLYYVVATDTLTGCSDTASAQITVYPQPELPTLTVAPFCANIEKKPTLPVSQGEELGEVTFNWYKDADLKEKINSAPDLKSLVAGSYNFHYTVTSVYNCLSDNKGTVPVIVYAVPEVPQVESFSFCLNDKENIPSLPKSKEGKFEKVTIQWLVNPESDLTKLSPLEPAYEYSYNVKSDEGCISKNAGFSILAMDVPSVSVDYGRGGFNICAGDSLPLSSIKVSVLSRNNDVTEKGWIIGDKKYESLDEIPMDFDGRSFYYYAENACGRSDTIGENEPVKVDVYYRHQSGDFGLAIEGRPDTTMFFIGEEVSLLLSAKEELISAPLFYHWYQVNDDFDGEKGYDLSGVPQLITTASDNRIHEIDLSNELPSAYVMQPEDSASYYVVVGDGVCPAVATNLVKIDVMSKLATAFTPYVKDGYNDLFLERHHVVIFDRYGQKVFEGDNGWDGTKSGKLVDPGVYFYTAQMKNGAVMNGSIEVVYNK